MKRIMLLVVAVLCLPMFALEADDPMTEDSPVELGAVHWNRDLPDVQKKSAESEKPILVLFQEVPG